MKTKTLKPKLCKVCQFKFMPNKPLQSVCSFRCAIEKNKKDKEKKINKETKQLKTSLMTVTDWKTILQTPINVLVRLIDNGQPCIATASLKGKANAGHYVSRSANDTIRFHLDNIHIQSEHSNSYKAGDTIRYQEGIRKVYGQEYFDYMETLNSHPIIKLSIPELQDLVKAVKKMIKEMKDADGVYTAEERIELRKKYNKQLGIYNY